MVYKFEDRGSRRADIKNLEVRKTEPKEAKSVNITSRSRACY